MSDSSFDFSLSNFSSHSTKSSNLNKLVSFDSRVKAKKVLHWSDYSMREKEACWYDEAELEEAIHSSSSSVVDATNEIKTSGAHQLNEELRSKARLVTLQEQQKQTFLGVTDHDAIAKVYGDAAKSAIVEAQLRALADAQEASDWVATNVPTKKEEILGDFNVCSDRASTLLARRKQRFAQRVTAKQVASTAAWKNAQTYR